MEHNFVSLTAPSVTRDPETLDPIETLKKDTGPNTSFHTAEFSDAQAETIRDDILKYNKDQPPEVLAKMLANFDRAAKADGLAVKPPLDPHLAEAYRDSGLKPEPSPSDYRPDFGETGRGLKPDRLANASSVTARWAAAIGFSPEVGTSVIERIVENGAALSKMTDDERAKQKDQWESQGLKIAGSKGALITLREKAAAVLRRAGPIDGAFGKEDFSASLRESLAVNDPFILSSLAMHADVLAEVEKAKRA
jgi:hypothetical protein